MTVWRRITGFPNYEVNRRGVIRRVDRKVLKPLRNGTGGYHVCLYIEGVRHNRSLAFIVLSEFGPARPSVNHQAFHKNGDKANNHIDNLVWKTRHETMREAYRRKHDSSVPDTFEWNQEDDDWVNSFINKYYGG